MYIQDIFTCYRKFKRYEYKTSKLGFFFRTWIIISIYLFIIFSFKSIVKNVGFSLYISPAFCIAINTRLLLENDYRPI